MKCPHPILVFALIMASCSRPRVDVSSKNMGKRLDHTICWTTWEDSELPFLQNLSNSTIWNDSIARFERHVKLSGLENQHFAASDSTFCCGLECEGDTVINFPFNEGLVGHFGYRILANTPEVLSLMLTCNVHPSGGTIDWNEFLIVNIDAQTGGVVPVPNNLKEIRMAKLDSAISGCANIEFCNEDYADYRHSSQFPNCLQEAVEKNRVGIVNGQWVMCLDFNPYQWCPSMAQNLCFVDLGVEWGK